MNRIVEADLSLERRAARDVLRDRAVPARFQQIDPGVWGFTRCQLDLLDALETTLAVLQETAKRVDLMQREAGEPLPPFPALHALFVAARVFSAIAPPPDPPVQVQGAFSAGHLRPLVEAPVERLHEVALDDCLQYLDFYRGHAEPVKRVDCDARLLATLHAWFGLLAAGARELGSDVRFERAVKATLLEVLDWRFDGFTVAPLAAQQDEGALLEVWPEDVVGNLDFLKAGMRLARDVAGFDLATRANPKRVNPVLFAMGAPGCGKTVTCHAIGNYFLRYCRERGIPARFVVITRTDWASSYQNASALQLVEIFKNRVAGFDGVVGVYWPDIDTAFAARSDGGLRSEEKNILGASFGIFDGTVIPKNGQWFMLTDANTLDMDAATISRITQDPFHLRGPVTADDFVMLLRDKKLGRHLDNLPLSEAQWFDLGRACLEGGLSGRAVENITRRVITEIEDFEYPDDYFKATIEERKVMIRQLSRPVDAARLGEIIEHYRRFEREAEERARRERFDARVNEIVFNMSAQAAALRVTDGG